MLIVTLIFIVYLYFIHLLHNMYFGIYQSKYTHLLLFDRQLLKSTGQLQDHQLRMQPHFPKIII